MRAVRVTVLHGRLRCLVALGAHESRQTNTALAARALAVYPTLVAHSCVNEAGTRFGDVIEVTSVPHLLEHIMIEEQLRAPFSSDESGFTEKAVVKQTGVSYVSCPTADYPSVARSTDGSADGYRSGVSDLEVIGFTQWVDEAAGTALIEVSFADDLVALRAFRDALAFLNEAMIG